MVCSWCGACIYCSILYCACNRQRPVIAMQNEAVFWNPLPGLWWNKSNMVSVTWKSTAGSILHNAFAVYGAVWYLLFFISQTVQRVAARFDRQINGMKFRDAALYIAIVVLIVQYLLKLFVPGYRI